MKNRTAARIMSKAYFFFLAVATIGVFAYPPNEPQPTSVSGDQHGRRKTGAIKKLFRNMAFGLSSSTKLVNTGTELCEKKKYADAIEYLDEAIRVSRDDYSFTKRGDCYQRQGRLDLAIADFEEALRLSDYKEPIRERLIQAYLRTGDLKGAEVETMKLTSMYNSVDFARGFCSRQQYVAAMRIFQKLIDSRSEKLPYISRAECRIKMGDLDGAREDFEKGVELDTYVPPSSKVGYGRVNFCHALINQGKLEEAVKEIRFLDDIHIAQIANELFDRRKYKEAIPFYTAAIEKFPRSTEYHRKRGKCYKQINDFGQAVFDLQKIMELEPTCASCCVDLIQAMVKAGQCIDAQDVLKNSASILRTGLSRDDENRLQNAKKEMYSALEVASLRKEGKEI